MHSPAPRTAVRDEENEGPDGGVDGAAVRVLLVEDDYDSFRLVERRLSLSERAEFQVEWAASLPDGLSEIDKAPYDAIVLDLALPGSEGMATIAGISAIARQIPIVVLTGSNNDALAMRAADCGIQDYLVKEQQDAQSLAAAVLAAIDRQRAGAAPPSRA